MERFNLDTWLEDKSRKVIDDDGFPVEIIKWDANEKYPVVLLNHNGIAYNVSVDGMYDSDPNHGIFFADEELTEFEKVVQSILNEPHFQDIEAVKQFSNNLLNLARKELQPEFDKELDEAYKTRDEVVYLEGYDKGHEDALKDLPKLKKMPNGIQGNGDFNPTYLVRASNGYYFTTPCLSWDKDSMYIELAELEKLPKEE